MATEIKTWQITDGKLVSPVSTTLPGSDRIEKDLEQWIKSNPEILGDDIAVIGEQVQTKSGPLDFLGIDENGNTVIVELKRDMLPREALAQAIDYASDVSTWEIERLSEICHAFSGKSLEDFMTLKFKKENVEDIDINQAQRILLIGFSIGESLNRMIEWLSSKFNVSINAIILSYAKTVKGDEILSRTVILPEEVEREKLNKRNKITIGRTDEPGNYDTETLREMLIYCFTTYSNYVSIKRMRDFMLPILLSKDVVTRDEMKKEMIRKGYTTEKESENVLPGISLILNHRENGFLRQIIRYEYPNYPTVKDNFIIPQESRPLVQEVLENLKETKG